MASALALSRAVERSLRVYWFKTAALSCPYGKLFEPIDGVEVIDAATGRLRSLFDPGAIRLRVTDRRTPYDLYLDGNKIKELTQKGIDLAEVVGKVERCGIDSWGRFYGTAPYFEDFKPLPKLVRKAETAVDAAKEACGSDDFVGVHIRRGDNEASAQVSPLDLFIERMDRELERAPETRFFLATDNPETERLVTGHFPGRVAARKKNLSRTHTRGVQDAMVDLLILSKCRLILGSYWSSFSMTAADMGGATLEVVRTPK